MTKIRKDSESMIVERKRGQWSESASRVLRERYLWRKEGKLLEDEDGMCARVADAVAEAERVWGANDAQVRTVSDNFFQVMIDGQFMPNSPTLMNAGKNNGQQLSACFVLPVGDSLPEIFDAIKHAAIIHQSGGGTGFGLSRLRAEGSEVRSTRGVASGPVSFLRVFNAATEAVKQGGCVVPETLVSTTQGMVRIGALGPVEAEPKSWHDLKAPLSVYTDEGSRRVEEFYHNGLAAVRKLRTTHGYGFTGTLEHRIRVIDDSGAYVWRRLQDLKVGDWVALQKHTYPHATDYRFTLPKRVPHFNATVIRAPEQPSAELGEFIGYLVGDGCINYYNQGRNTGRLIFTVADAEPDVADRLADIAAALFGVTAERQAKANDASTNYFFNQTELVAWLVHNGFNKASALDACVPEPVFQAGAAFARGFLRGLFTADGTISVEGYPSLTTISPVLADGVQQLLLALGIPSSISVREDRSTAFGKNPIYRLRIITRAGLQEFAEHIGFMSVAKNARLSAGLAKAWEFNDVIPNQHQVFTAFYAGPGRGSGPGRGTRGANRTLYRDIQHYLPEVAAPRQLTRSRLSMLAEKHEAVRASSLATFLDNSQFYDRIASIEDGEAVTVDLSVEQNHTYIANGFVSHNTRRGANMGVLRVDHPDILQFIDCKRPDPKTGVRDITNFNISVAATDAFMEALANDGEYTLIHPHTGQEAGTLRAREVFDRICAAAWATGDPGLLFIDRANHSGSNPIPDLEQIEATNPCGEQWLGGYDACNLGSINLANCTLKNADGTYAIDWTELERVTRVTTRFLDDVIEINPLPLERIRETVRANRRIGLGIMGWADLLFLLAIPYDSEEALRLGEEVMRFVNRIAHEESHELAKARGAFPNFEHSIYRDGPILRNATLTTVAPTGSISIIADCSSGIEPVFALAFMHVVDRGKPTERKLVMTNPIFERIAREQGFYSDALMEKISEHGSVLDLPEVPERWRRVFVNAHEVSPEWHIRMQAAFQHGVDNSISKTINLPNSASMQDVADAYLLAYAEGCKGITVFRDGCLATGQVLNVGTKDEAKSGAGAVAAAAPVSVPQPAPTPEPAASQPATPQMPATVKPRPAVVFGYTRQVKAPEGTANITINSDEAGPLEVFISVGRAGSDIAALAEGMGRLISLCLRLPSAIPPDERLQLMATQLRGIGGSRSIGFGAERVLSLPDAVSQALSWHLQQGLSNVPLPLNKAGANSNGHSHGSNAVRQLTLPTAPTMLGNICPSCGSSAAFVLEEGCKKCHGCGYSEC